MVSIVVQSFSAGDFATKHGEPPARIGVPRMAAIIPPPGAMDIMCVDGTTITVERLFLNTLYASHEVEVLKIYPESLATIRVIPALGLPTSESKSTHLSSSVR
jgi:hypothetical protein